jgi:hypothetical protein
MNDLSTIKRLNSEAAKQFGKAAAEEERAQAKADKVKRVAASHRKAKAEPGISRAQQNIATILKNAGRKVAIIDETKKPQ